MRSVLWIHIGCESVSSFLPQFGSGSREPNQCGFMRIESWSVFAVTKVELNYFLKNILYVGHKAHLHGWKCLFERLEFMFICQLPCSWIRIRISNLDPDLREPNNADHCRSGSTSMYKIVPLRTCADLTCTVFYLRF